MDNIRKRLKIDLRLLLVLSIFLILAPQALTLINNSKIIDSTGSINYVSPPVTGWVTVFDQDYSTIDEIGISIDISEKTMNTLRYKHYLQLRMLLVIIGNDGLF